MVEVRIVIFTTTLAVPMWLLSVGSLPYAFDVQNLLRFLRTFVIENFMLLNMPVANKCCFLNFEVPKSIKFVHKANLKIQHNYEIQTEKG